MATKEQQNRPGDAAYPAIAPGFLQDLLSRREFRDLLGDHPASPLSNVGLQLQSHQRFVAHFMNPLTEYRCLHLWHATGTGKTIATLTIVDGFVKLYRAMFEERFGHAHLNRFTANAADRVLPTVWVLGYGGTKAAFTRELLRHPQFGIVSFAERDALQQAAKMAERGDEKDVATFRDMRTKFKGRISAKTRGGFLRFAGYDEFFNSLFLPGAAAAAAENLTGLDSASGVFAGSGLEAVRRLAEMVRRGDLILNAAIVKSLEHSLLVCDEAHHMYNMNFMNKRGVMVMFLLQTVATLRLLTLSATVMNHSSTEIVSMMNLLRPDLVAAGRGWLRGDLFREQNGETQLRPGAAEELREAFEGRVSVLQAKSGTASETMIPDVVWAGEPFGVPLLRAVVVPMSEFHHRAVRNSAPQREDASEAAAEAAAAEVDAPTMTSARFDVAVPTPQGVFFSSQDIVAALAAAKPDWTQEHGIALLRQGNAVATITGPGLVIPALHKISAKFARLVEMLLARGPNGGKSIVFHPRVQLTGIVMIREILLVNGFLEDGAEPTAASRCIRCRRVFAEHGDEHRFQPIVFACVHSKLPKERVQAIISSFNAVSNNDGSRCSILLGSELIEESYDFTAIRAIFVLSAPLSMTSLVQLIGRGARTGSHRTLPPADRNCLVVLLVHGWNRDVEPDHELPPDSPEIAKYRAKLIEYRPIVEVGAAVAEVALVNWGFRPGAGPWPAAEAEGPASAAAPLPPLRRRAASDSVRTFEAYGFAAARVDMFRDEIVMLFSERPCWTLAELQKAVVSRNTVGEDEEDGLLFHLALDRLCRDAGEMVIHQVGRYYCFVPRRNIVAPLGQISAPNDHTTRNRQLVAAFRSEHYSLGSRPMCDVDFWKDAPNRAHPIIAALGSTETDDAKSTPYGRPTSKNDWKWLISTPIADQIAQVKAVITSAWRGRVPSGEDMALVEMLAGFGAVVTVREILKYRNVAAQIWGETIPAVIARAPAGSPCGFGRGELVELFVAPNGPWVSVPKTNLNRHTVPPEPKPPLVVGIIESGSDGVNVVPKFKTRAPRHGPAASDSRLIERGIVCSTKPKQDLEALLVLLRREAGGARNRRASAAAPPVRILCSEIFDLLVELERQNQAKSWRDKTKKKWLFSWWDDTSA